MDAFQVRSVAEAAAGRGPATLLLSTQGVSAAAAKTMEVVPCAARFVGPRYCRGLRISVFNSVRKTHAMSICA